MDIYINYNLEISFTFQKKVPKPEVFSTQHDILNKNPEIINKEHNTTSEEHEATYMTDDDNYIAQSPFATDIFTDEDNYSVLNEIELPTNDISSTIDTVVSKIYLIRLYTNLENQEIAGNM
jgi:hypothetical protein